MALAVVYVWFVSTGSRVRSVLPNVASRDGGPFKGMAGHLRGWRPFKGVALVGDNQVIGDSAHGKDC